MNWVKTIEDSIEYIERNLTEDLTVGRIAQEVNTSAFYFQRGFSMLCGYTVGEYVRMRRLSIAGEELLASDVKVIDIAMKYGYDSPDSFTKAFTRFHGSTPTDVRRGGAMLKSFAPLHIKLTLEGGNTMEYRIEKKPAFKVMGVFKNFSYENANAEVPQFWNEVFMQAAERPMPLPLQEVNRKIFSEWLPASNYEIAEGYNIEYYSNPEDFTNEMQDAEYYAEVWIPVKEK